MTSFLALHAWAFFTVLAAAAQTARNAMQRGLTAKVGVAGASWARFIFALPFALLSVSVVVALEPGAPVFEAGYTAWLLLGSLAQMFATGTMLLAMRDRSFVAVIAYTKTEPIQVAVFALVLLGEHLTPIKTAAVLLGTVAVMLFSWPRQGGNLSRDLRSASWGMLAGAAFPLAAAPAPLRLAQTGGAGPWATVSVSAAVPLTKPLAAGYRMTREVSVVQARNAGRLTRGDVVKVTITVDASAERNWVVVSDPVPAGATIVGDLGGQSAMLQAGNDGEGVSPAYVERGREAWRAYFAWVPRGRFQVSYSLRLNGAGRFNLPPSWVEALYSPAIRAAVPNAPLVDAAQ